MKSLKRKLFVNRKSISNRHLARNKTKTRSNALHSKKQKKRFHCATTMWKGFRLEKSKQKSEIGAIKQLICLNIEIFDYFSPSEWKNLLPPRRSNLFRRIQFYCCFRDIGNFILLLPFVGASKSEFTHLQKLSSSLETRGQCWAGQVKELPKNFLAKTTEGLPLNLCMKKCTAYQTAHK